MPQGRVKEERNNEPDLAAHRIRLEYVGKLKKSYRHPGNKGGCAIAGANNNYFFLVINLYNNNNNHNNNNNNHNNINNNNNNNNNHFRTDRTDINRYG